MPGSVDDQVLVALHRAALLARRPGVAILAEDAAAADGVTGARPRTRQAVHRLLRSGRAEQVRRGVLVLRNDIGLLAASVLELVVAVAPAEHLVTGAHALHEHGLLDEAGPTLVTLVPHPVAGFVWRRRTVALLAVPPARLWGGSPVPTGPARRAPRLATPERALIDAIAHPRHGVPLPDAAAALSRALHADGAAERLAAAVARYGVAAVTRRVGWLTEHVAGPAAADAIAPHRGRGSAPVPLVAGGPDGGPADNRWGVRVNVSPGVR